MLMAEAPDIQPVIASAFLQTITFFFIQLMFSSQTNHTLFLHFTLKQPLQPTLCKPKHRMTFHRKHKCKVKKKPPYARRQPTNIQKALTFVLLLIWKVDCYVSFSVQTLRRLSSSFTTTLSSFLHFFRVKHVGPTYALAATSSLAG